MTKATFICADGARRKILNCTAAGRQANSRLACQMVMSAATEGIVVRIANPQV